VLVLQERYRSLLRRMTRNGGHMRVITIGDRLGFQMLKSQFSEVLEIVPAQLESGLVIDNLIVSDSGGRSLCTRPDQPITGESPANSVHGELSLRGPASQMLANQFEQLWNRLHGKSDVCNDTKTQTWWKRWTQ
jgi:hypothetical protein